MSLHVYLLCHNEGVLLPHTIEHYRRHVPGDTFTILDNESDDRSVAIATELGCTVQTFATGGKIDDVMLRDLKNSVWKQISNGWVIVADMDEWLCVTAEDLAREERSGTTILRTFGLNVFGDSASPTLDDIDLHALNTGQHHPPESKAICFRRPQISAMNYNPGAHKCAPVGDVRWSKRTYLLKHMAWLGRPFIVEKYQKRYARGKEQQVRGLGTHYTDDAARVSVQYQEEQRAARPFSEAPFRTPRTWLPTLVRVVKRLRRLPAGVQRRARRLIG
jgi:hypothetical protein